MIIRLIQDIRKALENELYFVALSSALTLPDICGKAAYSTERSSRKRYILWYDEEIGKYEKNPEDKENRDKFHFNYEIIDWDEVTSHFPPIDMTKVFEELAKNNEEFYPGRKMGENE